MDTTILFLARNQKGQGLIEYLVLVALMAVATMGIMRILSQTTSAKFAQITQALQGRQARIEVQSIEDTHFKKKDMSDFFHGTNSRSKNNDE